MASNPISMSIVADALRQQARNMPGLEALLKNQKLMEKIALSMASGMGDKPTDDYIAATIIPEAQARGRSKNPEGQEDEEAVVLKSLDPIARPNGDLYYPRLWGDKYDVEVLAKAREHAKYTLFVGEPGTGKTVVAEAAFGAELHTVMITGDTSVDELVGTWVPKPEGGFMWVDGPLVNAAEKGEVIFLDEIGLADPKVLSAVYSLMDSRQELMVTTNPLRGIVKAKPGFYVVAATNPHAPGVHLSEALLSRFALHAEITTDYEMAVKLGVSKKLVGVAQNLSKRQRDGIIRWSPQFRELIQARDLTAIFGAKFAYENMIASAPEEDRFNVREVLMLVTGEKDLESAKI